MLRDINISNYSVIDRLNVSFTKGMNIISGETGAGKTVLIKAIELVLGARADTDKAEHGKSTITASFEVDYDIIDQLASLDIDAENPLIIKRVIEKNGKSRAYVNDIPVTVGLLKNLGDSLVDIHGQYDHQFLLKKNNQINLIDMIAGNSTLINMFQQQSEELNVIEKNIREAQDESARLAREKEFIEFAYNELNEFDPLQIDEPAIVDRMYELENCEDIKEQIAAILHLCEYNEEYNLTEMIGNIKTSIEQLAIKNSRFCNIRELFNTISVSLDEAVNEMHDVSEQLIFDDAELNELRNTVSKLDKLKRKYKMELPDLILYRDKLEEQLEMINFPEERIRELKSRRMTVLGEMQSIADKIHDKRKTVSDDFEKRINSHLKALNMKGMSIKIIIEKTEQWRKNGYDDLEFYITNKYKPTGMPLKEIASGGELSRIMLAIKSSIDKYDPVGTMIFDEIDTGIGGNTADRVGDMLKTLSEGKQILIITHLPQIAAKGDTHFIVEKDKAISIRQLSYDDRINEIARMLGSSVSKKTAIRHAKALLEK